MKKFEYSCIYRSLENSADITEDELKDLGEQGWELCGINSDGTWNTYYLKREICESIYPEIKLHYQHLVIDAVIVKDLGDRALVIAQDRVALAFKKDGEWISYSSGFDLLSLTT